MAGASGFISRKHDIPEPRQRLFLTANCLADSPMTPGNSIRMCSNNGCHRGPPDRSFPDLVCARRDMVTGIPGRANCGHPAYPLPQPSPLPSPHPSPVRAAAHRQVTFAPSTLRQSRPSSPRRAHLPPAPLTACPLP
ncbi:hypothetical protein CBM2587_A160108 [Cupriavidus taiwanensis]|uniref:Uncharacterized protein n=1 Tax=Cupriavidus taiwanensis TaxID=164546 RepID=A0A375BIQ2_9BURK|nr:hypothetical protein CBM2587_A160108 [Cupriavidus taiwanensis]